MLSASERIGRDSIYSYLARKSNIQSNLNGSNSDGSNTMDNSNSFLSPYEILLIAQENKIFRDLFLFHYEMVWCVYSLESTRRGDFNEYTQHKIIV